MGDRRSKDLDFTCLVYLKEKNVLMSICAIFANFSFFFVGN